MPRSSPLAELYEAFVRDENERRARAVANSARGDAAAVALESHPGKLFNSRLIGLAMLVGVGVAAIASPSQAKGCMKAFFEGAGYGFANIVSLIVTATCFGKGIELVGLADVLGRFITANPGLLQPLAGAVPAIFAFVCGSGMASTMSDDPTLDPSAGTFAPPPASRATPSQDRASGIQRTGRSASAVSENPTAASSAALRLPFQATRTPPARSSGEASSAREASGPTARTVTAS